MLRVLIVGCLMTLLSGCSMTTHRYHQASPGFVYTTTYRHYHPVKVIRVYKKKKRVVRKLRRAPSSRYYWYVR
jgi:hypothetical protein